MPWKKWKEKQAGPPLTRKWSKLVRQTTHYGLLGGREHRGLEVLSLDPNRRRSPKISLTTKSPEKLTVREITSILKKNNISFNSGARKRELLGILEQHKLRKVLQDNLPQPSKHPLGANTLTSHGSNVGQITRDDQVQKEASEMQSGPQVIRSISEQAFELLLYPLPHFILSGVTDRRRWGIICWRGSWTRSLRSLERLILMRWIGLVVGHCKMCLVASQAEFIVSLEDPLCAEVSLFPRRPTSALPSYLVNTTRTSSRTCIPSRLWHTCAIAPGGLKMRALRNSEHRNYQISTWAFGSWITLLFLQNYQVSSMAN
jgi:hypothetical protein